jgi:hypothetical protein
MVEKVDCDGLVEQHAADTTHRSAQWDLLVLSLQQGVGGHPTRLPSMFD